jgi:hypothetical protein
MPGATQRHVEERDPGVEKGAKSPQRCEQFPTLAESNEHTLLAAIQQDNQHHAEAQSRSGAAPIISSPAKKRPADDQDWESAAALFAESEMPPKLFKKGRYSDLENHLLEVVHKKLQGDTSRKRRTAWCRKLADHLNRPIDVVREKLRQRDKLYLDQHQSLQQRREHTPSTTPSEQNTAAKVPSSSAPIEHGAGLFDEVSSAVVGELSTLEDDGVSDGGVLPGCAYAMNDID